MSSWKIQKEIMANVKDYIDQRDNSINAIYMSYNACKVHDPNLFFAFVEGYDSPYYSMRIERISNKSVQPIICKSKDNVKKVYNLMESKGQHSKNLAIGYFVDADYDRNEEYNPNGRIFVTPCYSIENLYCTETCMIKILINEFHYQQNDEDYKNILQRYVDFQEEFNEAALNLNIWYCAVKRNNQLLKVDLGKDSLSEFVNVNWSDYTIGEVMSLDKICERYLDVPRPSSDDFVNAEDYLRQDPIQRIRGKFELHFTITFLMNIASEIKGKKKTILDRRQNNFNVGMSDAISRLSQYADDAYNLETYIKQCLLNTPNH